MVSHSNSGYIRGCRCDVCKTANAEYRRNRYRMLLDLLIEEWGGRCVDCGAKELLEFHHLDPSTKVQKVTWFVSHKGVDAAIEEARKCVLLCDRCHDLRHGVDRRY